MASGASVPQWLNTLVSVVLGFLAGLLNDPVRTYLIGAANRRQMRRALYSDVLRTFQALVAISYRMNRDPAKMPYFRESLVRYLRGDLFEYYCHADPGNLYRLPEFRALENLYRNFSDLLTMELPAGHDYQIFVRDLVNIYDYYVRHRKLSRWTTYRCGGWRLVRHWRDKRPPYSFESIEELL
ncbi:MAG: hypothetical protein ABSG25_08600 [Bryobacteraceae bacterium]